MFRPMQIKTMEYVETPNGKLRGYRENGIYAFLGVPYGECERWRTATPAKPWKGVRNAVQFGNRAFPAGLTFTPLDSCGVPHELYNYSEDCLNLNIWTPTTDRDGKKPVLVWIHGGGYSTGSAMEMQAHDGENLAAFGDCVVVTLNHRLNVFGFLDCSRFGEKYANSCNCGLSDLVLALQWVHDNIACFGGDDQRVLIYGQSGGGGKVQALLQTPAADGLFQKAVIMSGTFNVKPGGSIEDESPAYSARVLDDLLELYGTDDIAVLEALTPEELLDAVEKISEKLEANPVIGRKQIGFRPSANEYYPGNIFNAGMSEHAKTVPVMLGNTMAEFPEMRIFNKHEYSEAEQTAIVEEAFPGQDAGKLIELWKKAYPGRCLTDIIETGGFLGRAGVIAYADARAKEATAPTYVYELTHDFPQQGGRNAWHCADIPIVFHNSALYPEDFHDGLLDGLEDAISASWVNMAADSDPNNPYLGVEWPPYREGDCATLLFGDPIEVRRDFDREFAFLRETVKLHKSDKYTRFETIIN